GFAAVLAVLITGASQSRQHGKSEFAFSFPMSRYACEASHGHKIDN
ncbi:hypothetical protein Tco_0956511, partial [Tanacetum coccineum]